MSSLKHIYWLTKEEATRLEERLAARGIKMKFAKGVVCTPLDEINKISCVTPEVWNETCARQGSWYRASNKNGLFLVVSSFEVEEIKDKKAATIRRVDFNPPKAATLEDKKALIDDPDFDRKVPRRWREIGDVEKRVFLRWAARLGSETEDFDLLYLSHTANHANFMNPRFFIREGETIIPYSIDRSAHLCSCCLELFQVIGAERKKKLVAPCPGAVLFARLEPDKFLLVETENTGARRHNKEYGNDRNGPRSATLTAGKRKGHGAREKQRKENLEAITKTRRLESTKEEGVI